MVGGRLAVGIGGYDLAGSQSNSVTQLEDTRGGMQKSTVGVKVLLSSEALWANQRPRFILTAKILSFSATSLEWGFPSFKVEAKRGTLKVSTSPKHQRDNFTHDIRTHPRRQIRPTSRNGGFFRAYPECPYPSFGISESLPTRVPGVCTDFPARIDTCIENRQSECRRIAGSSYSTRWT